MSLNALPRHARPAGERPGATARPSRRLPRARQASPAGAAPREQGPAAPLTGTVAVTEWAVIGDQIRRPIAWCEIPPCISWYAHPAALGEADNRARALAAGWRTDAVGRLACPRCQQHSPQVWAAYPVVPFLGRRPPAQRKPAPGHRKPPRGRGRASRHAKTGQAGGAWSAAAGWLTEPGRRALRWARLLATLADDANSWNTRRWAPAHSPPGLAPARTHPAPGLLHLAPR